MIWTLTKLSYLGNGGIKAHLNVTTKKDTKASKAGVALLLVFLAFYLLFSFFSSGAKMLLFGSVYDYAAYFMTVIIIEFFFLFSSSDNIFMKSRELEILVTFPVTKRDLFISRVNMMLIEGYVLSGISYLGLLLASVIYVKFSLLWYAASLLLFLTMPLLVTTVCALLTLYLSRKPSARKIKRIIYYSILVAFLYSYMKVYMGGIEFFENGIPEMTGVVENKISYSVLAIAALFVLFFLIVLPPLEKRFLSVREEEDKKKEKVEKISASGVRRSLMKLDLSIILGEPSFSVELFGEAAVPIILLVVYAMTGIIGEMASVLSGFRNSPYASLAVLAAVCSMGAMNGLSSTSFSREGKDHKLLESLPITKRDRFLSKYSLHLLISLPMSFITMIAAGLYFRLPLHFYLIGALTLFSGATISSFLGLYIDSNAPYLEWTRPQMAVKNNMNMLKAMGATTVLLAIAFLPAFLIVKNTGMVDASLILVMAISAIFAFVSYKVTMK